MNKQTLAVALEIAMAIITIVMKYKDQTKKTVSKK